MANASRFSLFWFLAWSAMVILVATGAQAQNVKSVGPLDALIQEIENLEVIHQINAGEFSSDRVGLQETSDDEDMSHRSILSQR